MLPSIFCVADIRDGMLLRELCKSRCETGLEASPSIIDVNFKWTSAMISYDVAVKKSPRSRESECACI